MFGILVLRNRKMIMGLGLVLISTGPVGFEYIWVQVQYLCTSRVTKEVDKSFYKAGENVKSALGTERVNLHIS